MKTKLTFILTLTFFSASPAIAAPAPDAAQQILADAGVQGGLIVHVGCGDGKLTAALRASESFLVHGLDTDAKSVEAARQHIQSLGLYGKASVDRWDGKRLPYADNLVNLLVAENAGNVSMDEVLRVLAPNGVALVAGKKTVKPWPKEIDEWTHYLHDASGNAVANDTRVGPPRHIQWWAGPKRSRHHDSLASMSAMVSAAGRVFYILDEGPTGLMHYPSQWKLIARDAFNGVLLWKQDINDWINQLYYFRSGPNWLPRRLVAIGERVYVTFGVEAPICVLDAASGKRLQTYAGSERTEELICHQNVLLAVVGDPKFMNSEAPKIWNNDDLFIRTTPKVAKTIIAYDADSGRVLWKKDGHNLAGIAPLSLAACENSVFYLDQENVHCLDLQTGQERWKAPFSTQGLYLRSFAPTLVAGKSAVLCKSEQRLTVLAANDGHILWESKGGGGFCSPPDVFVVGQKVWITSPGGGGAKPGPCCQSFDLLTGTTKDTIERSDAWHLQHHHRFPDHRPSRDGIHRLERANLLHQ
jgi:outer membrane protein assembly factor BamB